MIDDKKTIIQKTGATDLRRSDNALKHVIAEKMKLPIKGNDIYAFANRTRTIMNAVNYNEDQTTMITIAPSYAPFQAFSTPKASPPFIVSFSSLVFL